VKEEVLDNSFQGAQINLDPRWYGTLRDRSGAGSGALVFPGWRRCRDSREEHVGLRHESERRHLGHADRYVSRNRLQAMLDANLISTWSGLGQERADTTSFFVFAEQWWRRSYRGTSECHGWME